MLYTIKKIKQKIIFCLANLEGIKIQKYILIPIIVIIILINNLNAQSLFFKDNESLNYNQKDFDLTGFTIYENFRCLPLGSSIRYNYCGVNNMEAVINPAMPADNLTSENFILLYYKTYIDINIVSNSDSLFYILHFFMNDSSESYMKITGMTDNVLYLTSYPDSTMENIYIGTLITDALLIEIDVKNIFYVNTLLYAPDSVLGFTNNNNNINFNGDVIIKSMMFLGNNRLSISGNSSTNTFQVVGGNICVSEMNLLQCQNDRSIHKGDFYLYNVNFLLAGKTEDGWDGSYIPTDMQYISTMNKLYLGTDSTTFTLTSYLEINRLHLTGIDSDYNNTDDLTAEEILANSSTVVIDGGYLNVNSPTIYSNAVNNLVINNGTLSVTTGGLIIYDDFTLQGSSSLNIGSGDLVFNGDKSTDNTQQINIQLTKYNENNFAIEVQNGLIQIDSQTKIHINIDTSNLLYVGTQYTYKLIKANNAIRIKNNIDASSPATWIDINTIADSNSIYVVATRTQSYSEVLTTSNANDFSVSLAQAIDKEMSDGEVSNDLAMYIYNLDQTGDAEGLESALGSNTPVDKNYFIHFLSINDTNMLNILQSNGQYKQGFWVDYNNSFGDINSANNSTNNIAIGYSASVENNAVINFGIGFGSGDLADVNFDSTLNAGYIGFNYTAMFEDLYFNFGLLNSYNTYSTNRFDNTNTVFKSKSNYYDVLFNVEGGKFIVKTQKISIKTGLYINNDAMRMFAYQENNDLGYVYDNAKYASSQGGINLSAMFGNDNQFKLKINLDTKIGYKINRGDSQNLELVLDTSKILLQDKAVDGRGLYIEPKLLVAYVINTTSLIQLAYTYEYMKNNYANNSISLMFKYIL